MTQPAQPPPPVRKFVHYSGSVQGVGFRYTAQSIAAGYMVAGWVRNRDDGDVELVVEGTADQVDAFLAELARRMRGYIERTQVHEEPPAGARGFQIRR
jgi:acylphosphatase